MFTELERLRQAYADEIALMDMGMPADMLEALLNKERNFMAAYTALEKQAAEIVRQYDF